MNWLIRLVLSSVGAKVLMALTGLVLVGFLVGHMVGNLQVFGGQEPLNAYAAFLHSKPALVWTVRAGVIGAALLHILSSLRLAYLNNAARPVSYRTKKAISSTWASRHMLLTGVVVLAFVAYHLLHLTWRVTHPAFRSLADAAGRPDVYSMVILSFRDPLLAGSYIVALVLLGLHLWHAVQSTFQSLGLNSPKTEAWIQAMSLGIATLIVLGNLTMPIAILMGWVAPAPGAMLP